MSRAITFTVLILFTINAFAKDQGVLPSTHIHEESCALRVTRSYLRRGSIIETPSMNDPISLMRGTLHNQAWGAVRTYFSERWDTQVFFTATGTPDRHDFEVPLVDPDSKGVILFVHGSGTVKSSGSNFVTNMSSLSNLGYSAISIDLPFHAAGPLQDRLRRSKDFIEWLVGIIEDLKASGKPVFLAGHSFGPEVMFEVIYRYPKLLAGVTALSPAGYNRVLQRWYQQFTSKMKFGGDVAISETGSAWSEDVVNDFVWNKGVLPDPTVANPDLRVRILVGDHEEYAPAPIGGPNRTPIGPNTYDQKAALRLFFENAAITVEKGIGHYLFDFKDENGISVTLREFLLMLGEDPLGIREVTNAVGRHRQAKIPSERLSLWVKTDFVFRAWFLSKYPERLAAEILRDQNDEFARRIIESYETAGKLEIFNVIMAPIFATEETHPEFYERYRQAIETARQRKIIDSTLVGPYFRMVNGGASVTIN